ncbi:MAG TPA: 2-oxo acid dehydrogenase subunit E2 [Pirellulales bacterium]|nr:2-oxo acid dehydrogenase subunit E2 [Pirellulales bacterium]
MPQPIEITVPRLGWSMEEGTLTEWLKRDGEWVSQGEMLFVLEGDKAAQEIESFESGILKLSPDGPRPGDTVKVGQVIGYLIERGAAAPFEQMAAGRQAVASDVADSRAIPSPPPAAGPEARRVARELGVDLAHVTGSGRGGRIVASDVRRITTPGHRSHHAPRDVGISEPSCTARSPADTSVEEKRLTDEPRHDFAASPRARRVAGELGIDWTRLTGSGRGGRVRERDVRAAAAAHGATVSAAPSSRRRTIAERMVASLRSTAPVTLTSRASAANLLNLRAQFKAAAASGGTADANAPSITDLLVKLAAAALARHPEVNSRWEGDGIIELAEINIGVAVDDSAGLTVPVIHNVQSFGVRQIASRLRELVERARSHRLTAEEMSGGTFTITNLGALGIDAFTPIIHSPQTAILGVGAIRREPVVAADDRIVPGDVMTLSLTFDHRVLDGAPAARFLHTLVEMIENPAAWLVA